MSSCKPSKTGGPPPLLQRLYPGDPVLSLYDVLLRLSRSSREAQQLKDTLLQPFDHVEYSQDLLFGTYCVVNAGAPPLQDGFTLHQSSDQLEVSMFKNSEYLSTDFRDFLKCFHPVFSVATAIAPCHRGAAADVHREDQCPLLWVPKGELRQPMGSKLSLQRTNILPIQFNYQN